MQGRHWSRCSGSKRCLNWHAFLTRYVQCQASCYTARVTNAHKHAVPLFQQTRKFKTHSLQQLRGGASSMGGADVKPDIKPTLYCAPPPPGYYYPPVAPVSVQPPPPRPRIGPNIALQVTVRDQQGDCTQFKIRRHTEFAKMFNAYCIKKVVDPGSYRFFLEGVRLSPESTPAEHGVEDQDVIEAFIEQQGGSLLPSGRQPWAWQ